MAYDESVVLFASDETLAPGMAEQHGLRDVMDSTFGRAKNEVDAEWQRVLTQTRDFVAQASAEVGGYVLDEVGFELGFSAEGHVVFIAKGGVQATIKLTFKRKEDAS